MSYLCGFTKAYIILVYEKFLYLKSPVIGTSMEMATFEYTRLAYVKSH